MMTTLKICSLIGLMKDLLSCTWKKKQVKSSLIHLTYEQLQTLCSDFKKATKTIIFMLLFPAFCLLDASEEEKKRLTAAYMCVNTEHTYYLVKGANRRLKHQVGVEEERAQERLRIGRQLGQDARQQQVDVKRVGQHVLHTGQQHTDEWTCVKKKKKSHG